ncbi:phosphoribosyltransferase [Enterococcus asini]|uniref:phosphoribosyltransferase n=1 Tax=Enterococcus asini TaxID=57732 RepID=UPI0022E7CF62|nr:phosphoribosyltransferase [Enterococcus asini]
MKENINIQTFSQLSQIFKKKSWKVNDTESSSLFNRISRTLTLLDSKEQETFLQLLNMMEYYTIFDYESLLATALKKMVKEMDSKKFLFSPMLSDRNNSDIKSSMLVTYLLKSNTIQYDSFLSELKMTLQMDLTDAQIRNINRKKRYLVLIDDFIGTGASAVEAAEYFISKGVLEEKIIILSLVTMTKGKELIIEKGFHFFYAATSLSLSEKIDSYIEEDKIEFERNVEVISKKIGINVQDFWGFKDSKAVLSMIRVPNNTIGAFWKAKNKLNVPFPRFS